MVRRAEGFALLAVLWVAVGVSTLALGASLAAREGVSAAANRMSLTVALWRAEDCLARSRAAIGELLVAPRSAAGRGSPPLSELQARWSGLDQALLRSPLLEGTDCELAAEAAGTRLDANAADGPSLGKLLRAAGISPPKADSLAIALVSRRPLADLRQLALVPGFDKERGLDTLLATEPGRVSLNHAPAAVLASLPGVGPETVHVVLETRAREGFLPDLLALAGALSPEARDSLVRHAPELAARATAEPDAWILRARGVAGAPPVAVVVELRLVRSGSRAAVVRRRSWIP